MTSSPAATRFNPRRIAAAVLLVVSALFCLEGARYPYMTSIGPGAGFFPVWVGGICAVMALLMLVLPPRRAPSAPAPVVPEAESERPAGATMLIVLTVGCLLIAAALLPYLGFMLVTSLLTAALLWIYERRTLVALVSGVIAGPVVFYLFSLLQVRLPTGVFGI